MFFFSRQTNLLKEASNLPGRRSYLPRLHHSLLQLLWLHSHSLLHHHSLWLHASLHHSHLLRLHALLDHSVLHHSHLLRLSCCCSEPPLSWAIAARKPAASPSEAESHASVVALRKET